MTTSTPSKPIHIEFLMEDASGKILLEALLPRLLGPLGQPHSWRVISYKGIGKVPAGLAGKSDPSSRVLLDQLPRLLRGYGNTPGIDAVVVVLDTDRRDCREVLAELQGVLNRCHPAPKTMFRLAIEEIEAWYFGDQTALLKAYPKADKKVLKKYQQDSVCGTWESFADAVHPGGSKALLKTGWPAPGQAKCTWAERMGPLLEPDNNRSPSFGKLREGVRRLVSESQ